MSRSMYDYMEEVKAWNQAAGHMEEVPDNLDDWDQDWNHRDLAASLIMEEVFELKEAIFTNDKIETADAIADILFTLFGLAAKSGQMEIVEASLNEVITSNWTKIDGNKNKNTKIGKPKGYKPPNLEPIVKKAKERGFL